MPPTPFDPLALREHRLFESRDLDETRERISRVMQPHALLPDGSRHGPSHMDTCASAGSASEPSRSATRCGCISMRWTAIIC